VRRASLDYPAVQVGLQLAGIEMTPELFTDMQVIEAGAILADRGEADW